MLTQAVKTKVDQREFQIIQASKSVSSLQHHEIRSSPLPLPTHHAQRSLVQLNEEWNNDNADHSNQHDLSTMVRRAIPQLPQGCSYSWNPLTASQADDDDSVSQKLDFPVSVHCSTANLTAIPAVLPANSIYL